MIFNMSVWGSVAV